MSVYWKFGISSSSFGYIDDYVFEEYKKAAVDCMEISLPKEQMDELDWNSTKKASERTGVELWSVHLPFCPFDTNNLASLDRDVRKGTIDYHMDTVRKMSSIGIRTAVVHPSGEPNDPKVRDELLKVCHESLLELADKAKEYGVGIAVEDLPRDCIGNCSDEILYLTSGSDNLFVCFDTNHLLGQRNEDFIKAVGSRIRTVHVSDYDFIDERHWLPYEGKNDWVKIVTLLDDAHYSGPFLYEVRMKNPELIKRRDLNLFDYRENYLACINKIPAPVISQDK